MTQLSPPCAQHYFLTVQFPVSRRSTGRSTCMHVHADVAGVQGLPAFLSFPLYLCQAGLLPVCD